MIVKAVMPVPSASLAHGQSVVDPITSSPVLACVYMSVCPRPVSAPEVLLAHLFLVDGGGERLRGVTSVWEEISVCMCAV